MRLIHIHVNGEYDDRHKTDPTLTNFQPEQNIFLSLFYTLSNGQKTNSRYWHFKENVLRNKVETQAKANRPKRGRMYFISLSALFWMSEKL
jgi:hypothetical protein